MPDDNPNLVKDVPFSTKDKVLGGLGSFIQGATGGDFSKTPLAQSIQKHHQQRLDEAQMHQRNYATYSAVLASGTNPDTHEALTPDEVEKYQNMRDLSWDGYEKAAGVNKDIKAGLQKQKTVVDALIQAKRGMPPPPQPGGQAQDAAKQTDNAPQAPASAQNAAPASAQAPGLPPPPAYSSQTAVEAPRIQQGVDDERKFQFWKRQQSALRDFKIEEEKAKAAAKGVGPSARPVWGPAISTSNAKLLGQQGKVFKDTNGNPIDLTELPESMGLKSITVRTANGWETLYEPFSPNSKVIEVGGEKYAISPMDVEKLMGGSGTDLGAGKVASTTKTTDPTTGQTTVSTRTPNVTPRSAAKPGLPAPPKASGTIAAPKQSTAPSGLDENGHIPDTFKGSTPQVIEGANQLLDGRDVKDIPQKVRQLSAELARKNGWEQGKFTPKDQVLLKESTTFLKKAMNDHSLKVLDDRVSAMKLAELIEKQGDKQVMLSTAITTNISKSLTNDEAAFLRMYNQLLGTISGLGQLVRVGKPTESSIRRLMSELPNPKTVQGSADAKKRMQRLLDEVDVAMEKGSFEGTGNKKGMPPPPQSASSMVTVQIPGHPPGQIPASSLKDFQKKHPNATVNQ